MWARVGLALLIGLPILGILIHGSHENLSIYWNGEILWSQLPTLGVSLVSAGSSAFKQAIRFAFARQLTADERQQARLFYGAFGRSQLAVSVFLAVVYQVVMLQNLGSDFGAVGGAFAIGLHSPLWAIATIELVLAPLCDSLDRADGEVPSRLRSGLPSLAVEIGVVALYVGLYLLVMSLCLAGIAADRLRDWQMPG